jgi:hypothetical protein
VKDEILGISWYDVEPGMRVRFTTPKFVKRGTLVAKKKASAKVRFDGEARDTVLPDARHYYAMAKGGHENNEWTLVVIEDNGSRELVSKELPTEEEEWITPAEAATLHGISPKRLRTLLRSGRIKGKQKGLGGSWLVDSASVERWLSGER